MRKLTYEEVKEVFESKGNKLISTTYEGNKIPLEYICDCGEIDKKTINSFKNGSRCKKCGDKKTGNGLRKNAKDIEGIFLKNGCIMKSDYVNSHTPIEFICSCGEKGETRINDFKKGSRCKKCNIEKRVKNKQKNNNYAKQYQILFETEGYEMLSPYIKAAELVEAKCPKGHEVKITPANFKTGYRCGECSPSKKKTYEEVFDFFKAEDYQLISTKYQDAFSKLQAICPKNHDVDITWDNFRAGKRCARCNESKGEKRVEKYLLEQNLLYERQFTFDDCKYKRELPFDFVVFNPDQTINCLIEYDGHFHYIATDMTGGEKGLKETQKRDKIKTDYCRKNNIQLIRIKYTEFDRIEEILDKEIKIKTLV